MGGEEREGEGMGRKGRERRVLNRGVKKVLKIDPANRPSVFNYTAIFQVLTVI